ncbi:zinc finger protein 277 isoform X2 [Cephus cinctus]|uniref:Zinc finger protein 277 isoform X2 n=1 Tax=Cephus cinctus TaxID=211228 RepID=A0AAJ7C436_CEPCN|nr:zinc finger protein 277 isoform X2 [Cephus cinctus]
MSAARSFHCNEKTKSSHLQAIEYYTPFDQLDDEPCAMRCLLCTKIYTLPTNEKTFLSHLFEEHRLIIGDVQRIPSLKCYLKYWGVKFSEASLNTFCSTLSMDCTPDGKPSKNECYFLLSDCLPEDKALRMELQRAKLEWVLAQQTKERADMNFKRGCMFCRLIFSGSRATYLKHLSQQHNIRLGKPENLVFVDQLLDRIENNIENLICVYCRKVFKDRTVLKEHMRKKLHKRINRNDESYDRFYMSNYLKQAAGDSTGTNNLSTISSDNSDNEENTWSDWNDEISDVNCLFCDYLDKHFASVIQHMKHVHAFDFEDLTRTLNFYQRVKIVNYVRRQIHTGHCIFCDATSADNILKHMREAQHFKLPEKRIWDQPEYYFPVIENDSFLCSIEVNSDEECDEQTVKRHP